MPPVILQRIVKNIALTFALLCLALTIGISMHSFEMFAIPAALALVIAGGTFRIFRRYAKGSVYICTATCTGYTKGFLPGRYDYTFLDENNEVIVVSGHAVKEFREGVCYEMLFERSATIDVPPVFIDSRIREKERP